MPSRGCSQITPLDASVRRIGVITLFKFRGSKFCRTFACVPSRWKVLSGEFRRRPTALVKKIRKPDRVGRRGLSEPREDFSRLPTNHTARRFCPSIWRNHALQIPWCEFCRAFACVPSHGCPQITPLDASARRFGAITLFKFRGANSVAHSLACPAVGKFSRASSAGGRRHLLKKFASRIVSVAEDCLSPERTFHGCPLNVFLRLNWV